MATKKVNPKNPAKAKTKKATKADREADRKNERKTGARYFSDRNVKVEVRPVRW